MLEYGHTAESCCGGGGHTKTIRVIHDSSISKTYSTNLTGNNTDERLRCVYTANPYDRGSPEDKEVVATSVVIVDKLHYDALYESCDKSRVNTPK